jgi:putative FmdB family regulatory protein
MPVYEYYCDKCDRDVTLTLTISQHEKGPAKCPKCGSNALQPLLSTLCRRRRKSPDVRRPLASSDVLQATV